MKRTRAWKISLTGLPVLATSALALATAAHAKTDKYVEPNVGFSIACPNAWKPVEKSLPDAVYACSPTGEFRLPYMIVQVTPLEAQRTPAQAAEESLAKNPAHRVIVPVSTAMVGGESSALVTADSRAKSGLMLRTRFLHFVRKTRTEPGFAGVRVGFTHDAGHFDSLAPAIDSGTASIRFN